MHHEGLTFDLHTAVWLLLRRYVGLQLYSCGPASGPAGRTLTTRRGGARGSAPRPRFPAGPRAFGPPVQPTTRRPRPPPYLRTSQGSAAMPPKKKVCLMTTLSILTSTPLVDTRTAALNRCCRYPRRRSRRSQQSRNHSPRRRSDHPYTSIDMGACLRRPSDLCWMWGGCAHGGLCVCVSLGYKGSGSEGPCLQDGYQDENRSQAGHQEEDHCQEGTHCEENYRQEEIRPEKARNFQEDGDQDEEHYFQSCSKGRRSVCTAHITLWP